MAISDQNKKDITGCEKALIEVLKKYGCHLESFATLRPGTIDMNIVIAKNPPAGAPAEPSPLEKAAAQA